MSEAPQDIPKDKAEVPQGPIEIAVELATSGKMYDAFRTYFTADESMREDAIREALQAGEQNGGTLYRAIKHVRSTPKVKFLLGNFFVLTNPTSQKLFLPTEGTQISENEIREWGDMGRHIAFNKFENIAGELDIDITADMDDFKSPQETLINFSLEDMEKFMLGIFPHVEINEDSSLFRFAQYTHPLRHAELLLNPAIATRIPETTFNLSGKTPPGWLENVLSQDIFPSPELFEFLFASDPDRFAPGSMTIRPSREPVPTGAYYFTMMRRIVHYREVEGRAANVWQRSTEELNSIKDKVTGYLLSDAFMERVISYIQGDTVYPDNLINPKSGGILYNDEVEATGEEAKEIMNKRFAEVLGIIEKHLQEKGDTETLDKLKSREVAGVRFSDSWPQH